MRIFVCSFIASFLLFCLFVFNKLRTRLRNGDAVVIYQNASTSETTLSSSKYDVFLSFRGEDTRKSFTDHLYTALTNAGFRTFRDDDELPRGEDIKPELQKAIQQSQSSVIVFSKDYASSGWCLDELVMILQCKATSNHVVFPVFYDIDPSHLRKQTGSLAKAFTRHQKKQSPEKLNRWREALTQVADLAGMVLQNQADGHESKFIQNIVKEIRDKLLGRLPLSVVQDVLQKKLLSINPVLDDAKGKQLNNPTVKTWLNELQEAVYDAEDLLQEIKTEVLRQKMEPESESTANEVQELISSHASNAFDLALINSRVDEVRKRLDSITTQRKDILGLEENAGHRVSETIPSTSLVQESDVYGRDEEKETFIKLLLSDDEKISVIPIVGMAGIGKTTLAQLLYNDDRVKQRFGLRAWVCVSEEFDILRISQHIYESVTSNANCQIMNLDLLQSKLKETLAGKRFFFVLDDIWNENYNRWELLWSPFAFGAHGSKIIVTTHNVDVASMMSTLQTQPHCLKPISEKDGWLLFEKHAFKSRGVGAHSHLEVIGRQIVRKCKGLPLAIKTLGGLLCSKLTVSDWNSILNSNMWELSQEKRDILPSLWLSYMYLPPYLKRCFAYCSIFPKNYEFQTSELVFLWMAEDLLQPQQKKTAEEIGKDYFNDLRSRSFFQLSSSDNYPQRFIMHDLINDVASFVSGEFCFRWEDRGSTNNLSKTRHFSYMIKYDDDEKCEALQQAKCLRTFLPLAPKRFKLLGEGLSEVLPKLQGLRMLKLSGYIVEELPGSVNNWKHLRHLDMSYTSIKKLPDTICTLYNLQTLLLLGCYNLTELPHNFGRLINLTHVDVEGTMLIKMPPHMGNLEDLLVLTKFVLDKHTAGDNLLELKKLQNLRGKLEMFGLEHGRGLEAYILRDKKFLNELDLHWGNVGEERNVLEEREVLEKLQPHLNLERLTIDGYGGKLFPGWSRYYSSFDLVYLKLYNCVNCISLPPLGQLPSLRELHISQLSGVVFIGSEFYYGDNVNKPFRSLQSLRIEFMSGWQEWFYVGDDHNERCLFPNLGELYLSDCPKLTGRLALDSFPKLKVGLIKTGFSHITGSLECPELVRLTLSDCPNFVSFPDGGLNAPNLTDIKIRDCEKLGSWPEQMHTLLPSLQTLSVSWSPELDSFPEGGLPAHLKSLHIYGCKKFNANSVQNLNKGLPRLTSLEDLSLDFDGCERVDSFPEETLLPGTLTCLYINHLNLKTMDGAKWFGHLNSLKTLVFQHCSALQCLPDTGLPSSLCVLRISECPLLAQWCRRQKWEDSPKIAHIRRIEIDGRLLTHVIED